METGSSVSQTKSTAKLQDPAVVDMIRHRTYETAYQTLVVSENEDSDTEGVIYTLRLRFWLSQYYDHI